MDGIRLEVHTRDIRLVRDIFGDQVSIGQQVQIAEGVSVRNDGTDEFRSIDVPAILHLTLEIADRNVEAVATGLIAAWLYDKLKGRVRPQRDGEKLVIERTVVELDEGKIKRVITEKLTRHDDT